MHLKNLAKTTGLSFLALAALSACSNHETQKQPAPVVKVQLKSTAPARSVMKVVPVQSAQTVEKANAQRFVTAFGHGTLKIMQETQGPTGLTAVIVAPSGTPVVTPTTPVALLWILPGGNYAMEGTLLNVAGHNLSLKYREKMGIIPPSVMSTPASPPVAARTTSVPDASPTLSAAGAKN